MSMTNRALALAAFAFLIAASPALAGEAPSVTNTVSEGAPLKCGKTMEITEPRFSSTAVVGLKASFSDLGCALVFRKLQCATDQMRFDQAARARDYHSGEEMALSAAWLVRDEALKTPLGYGFAAFKDRAGAERYIKENGRGRLLSYSEATELDLR